jgi:hypothetical protein
VLRTEHFALLGFGSAVKSLENIAKDSFNLAGMDDASENG